MHVSLHGLNFPISNDFDPDYGQEWTWDGEIPTCESCGDTLVIRDGSKLVEVDVDFRRGNFFVVCACGETQEIH